MAVPEDPRPGEAGAYTEKESVRKQALRARAGLSAEERGEKSSAVVERIAALPEFRAARTVMLYRAVRGELSLETLPAHPAAAGKRFVYPRCVSRTEMEAMLPGGWKPGPFGIPEPDGELSETVPPEEMPRPVPPA